MDRPSQTVSHLHTPTGFCTLDRATWRLPPGRPSRDAKPSFMHRGLNPTNDMPPCEMVAIGAFGA